MNLTQELIESLMSGYGEGTDVRKALPESIATIQKVEAEQAKIYADRKAEKERRAKADQAFKERVAACQQGCPHPSFFIEASTDPADGHIESDCRLCGAEL
jgi:hypothetical protein